MKKYLTLILILILFSLLIAGCAPPKDTTPPQVSITSPQNGAEVSGTVIIQASATDNIRVSKVEFYIDGSKVGEDTESPYTCDWDTTQYENVTHMLTAKAYDNVGNVGQASISVNVNNLPAGPQYVEAGTTTWYSGIETVSKKVIDKITQNKKIHPKLNDAIKKLYSGVKTRTNVSNFKPLKSQKLQKIAVLPEGYHIYLEIWWSQVENASNYNVYLSDDGVNYYLITTTNVTDIYWDYADEDLGLTPATTYYVKVKAIVNGIESKETIGSWSITPLGVVNLISPQDRQLNVLTNPLNFSWQNCEGNPTAWDIDVYNEWNEYGWYYSEEGIMKNTITYNYDGNAYPLYKGATYKWYVDNYGNYHYSNIRGDYYYFSNSWSMEQLFQTYAHDYIKVSWGDTNYEIDLNVLEPNGNWYNAGDSNGYETPNGFFVGNEPGDHQFYFEQYSWKDLSTATTGTYYFYGYNYGDYTKTITVSYQIKEDSDTFNVDLDPKTDQFLLSVEITTGAPPVLKVYKDKEIPPELQQKLPPHTKVKTKK
jgi:hypothetical protein